MAKLNLNNDDHRQIFAFGKYKGEAVEDVAEDDPAYVVWAQENVDHFNCERDIYLACCEHVIEEFDDDEYALNDLEF